MIVEKQIEDIEIIIMAGNTLIVRFVSIARLRLTLVVDTTISSFSIFGGCGFAIMDDTNHPDAFAVRLQPTRRTTYWDRCNRLHAGDINERRVVQRVWKEII